MLEVTALSFEYQDKQILDQITFTLRSAQLLHLRGGNGTGKTTLLKLLAGLLPTLAGEIRYNGQVIHENLPAYQRNICFVGHKTGIHPFFTVKENCLFDLHWGRKAVDLLQLLAQYGLQGLENELCANLSSGQCRRVSLLRTALTDASLWLLDEPMVGLDTEAMALFLRSVEEHLALGGQVLLTSHQPLVLTNVNYAEYCLGQ